MRCERGQSFRFDCPLQNQACRYAVAVTRFLRSLLETNRFNGFVIDFEQRFEFTDTDVLVFLMDGALLSGEHRSERYAASQYARVGSSADADGFAVFARNLVVCGKQFADQRMIGIDV